MSLDHEARSSDDVIERLTRDLKPVRPLPPPWRSAVLTSLGAVLLVVTVLLVVAPREDWRAKFGDPAFFLSLILPLALLLVVTYLAALLERPGRQSGFVWWVSGGTAGALTVFSLYFMLFSRVPAVRAGLAADVSCGSFVMAFAAALAAILFWRSRKAAPMKPWVLGAVLGVAGFAAGCFAIMIHCGSDDATHIALWHVFLPGVAATTLATVAGRRFLCW